MTGRVLYRGPSLLDGAPIVAVAIDASANRKTGDMVQTYILRADVAPQAAIRSGQDASICGDCKHRPGLGGACYVVIGHGPASVWRALQAGRYAPIALADMPEHYTGRVVRLGAYGDPAAVPDSVWRAVLERSAGHTGYTHQWRRAPALRDLCMASVDSEMERAEAHATGWRTFRVRCGQDAVLSGEVVCPASAEAGKRRTCATCKACDGAARGTRQASVVVVVHGMKAKLFDRRMTA